MCVRACASCFNLCKSDECPITSTSIAFHGFTCICLSYFAGMSDQVDFQDVQIEQCDLDMNEQDFEDQQLYLEEIRQRESERADEVGGEKERKEDESFSQARVAGSHSDRGESHQQAFSSASAGGDYHTASSGDHPAAFESSSESRMPPHGSVSADAPIEKPPRKRAYKSKKR